MKILYENTNLPQKVALILGFFDGIHAGHRNVIQNTQNQNKVLVTFQSSPAEFFNKDFYYIYPRDYNYKLIKDLGVNYIYEQPFEKIVDMQAKDYLEMLINKFNPTSITTGFNHTFGANRKGNSKFLTDNQSCFEYYCTEPTIIDKEIVSSTNIKNYLSNGNIEKANKFLKNNFTIISTVIEGQKLGRELGFPTANLKYPNKIVKLPYGVYKIKVLDKIAIMNWGTKPTIGNTEEILEIHIPNFDSNLYGKTLNVEIISKIRDEIKFNNLKDLKIQIKKDITECLK